MYTINLHTILSYYDFCSSVLIHLFLIKRYIKIYINKIMNTKHAKLAEMNYNLVNKTQCNNAYLCKMETWCKCRVQNVLHVRNK